jgi:hypothetical protein
MARGWRNVGGPLAGAIAITLATPVPIDSARWWRSSRIVAELRLSPRQAREIDGIFQSMRVQSADCARTAAAAHRSLDAMLDSPGVDDVFEMAASRLADTESICRRTRTLMLYRMFRVLTVEQRQGLAAIAARTRVVADQHVP